MKRYVLLKEGAEIASAAKCKNVQPVLFALLMVAQANAETMEGFSWELPESQAKRIGRMYGWGESRHDSLYGMPIKWVREAAEA